MMSFIVFLYPQNKLDPYSLSFSGFPQHADYDAEMCDNGANRYTGALLLECIRPKEKLFE